MARLRWRDRKGLEREEVQPPEAKQPQPPPQPARVVRKVRRWYDDEPRIMNRQF